MLLVTAVVAPFAHIRSFSSKMGTARQSCVTTESVVEEEGHIDEESDEDSDYIEVSEHSDCAVCLHTGVKVTCAEIWCFESHEYWI